MATDKRAGTIRNARAVRFIVQDCDMDTGARSVLDILELQLPEGLDKRKRCVTRAFGQLVMLHGAEHITTEFQSWED